MNAIQEALRELNRFNEAKKTRKVRVFDGLWDQVYCSLTDGGADAAYKALGDLSGKSLYDVYDITGSDVRPGFDTIIVNSSNTEPAVNVANVYGLETKVIPGKAVYIYVPEGAPVRHDLLAKNRVKSAPADEALEDEIIEEDFDDSLPVQPLDHDTVYTFIENVPVATATRPPVFFPVGYMREFTREIPAKFKGGRGSEGNPSVRIVKCSEMTVYTGADYENLQATKDMRKETGRARSGEKTGFSFAGEATLANKIGLSSSGEEQLQCYIKRGTQPKAKYFISIDGEAFRAADKDEVAQYLTPAHANLVLNGRESAGEGGAKIVRLKLANIYKIGSNGVSVIR